MNNAPEKKEIDLLEYWRIVLKRKWVLATTLTVIVVLAAIRSFTATPLYQATASILIEDPASSMLNIQDLLGTSGYYGNNYLGTYFNTELKLLTSRSLAERVAKRMNLPSRPEIASGRRGGIGLMTSFRRLVSLNWLFTLGRKAPAAEGGPAGAPRAPLNPYAAYAFTVLGGLSVEPVEETRLVNVHYISEYPKLAADVVNSLVEEFVTYSVESRYEATQKASEFLSEQIAQLTDELQAKETQLQRYREDTKLVVLNDKESSVVNQFADVNAAFTAAQIDRYKAEAQYRELKALDVDSLPQFISNPTIQSLKTTYLQAKAEYDEKSKLFRPEYPEVVRLKARADGLRGDLQTELRKAVDAAESDYRAAQKKEASLQSLLDTQRTDVARTNNSAITYNILNTEVINKRNLLNSLVARQNETLVSARLGGQMTSNIKVVDRALVPGGPFTPNTRRNLMMALLLGLFVGVGLIFVVEYLDNTVKGPEDAEKLTGLPSLGVIPFLAPEGRKRNGGTGPSLTYGNDAPDPGPGLPEVTEIELVNHLFPKFTISEDYRTIRTSILFAHSDQEPKTICFTSTLPQEGKTATVSNLAISFAQLEGRVLLIDADLRKPRLHKVFNVRNLVGLSTCLTGRVPVDDAIQKTAVDNIWILPSGPHPPNPAELLNSKRMRDLLAAVKERFDTVLIDTPPVLAVIDPVVVSSLTDCTVFVIKAGKTTRKPLSRAVERIRRGKADILGVVFNQVRIGRGSSVAYYQYYQYEYSTETGKVRDRGTKGPEAS